MIDFTFLITRSGGSAVDCSEYVTHPYSIKETLDESLDQAMITLKNTSESTPFMKSDRAVFSGTNRTTRSFAVIHDDVKSIYSTGLYEHTLTLIENTKDLETVPAGGGKCFTQPLQHDYESSVTQQRAKAYYTASYSGGSQFPTSESSGMYFVTPASTYITPLEMGAGITLYGPSLIDDMMVCKRVILSKIGTGTGIETIYTIGIIDIPPYDVLWSEAYEGQTAAISKAIIASRTISQRLSGVYRIRYDNDSNSVDVFLRVSVADETPLTAEREDITVYEAGKRLCETAECILSDESPRYTFAQLSSDNIVDYATIKAPELSIGNNRSLWEAMLELARFVHAVPRLYGSIIKFDRLGSQEYANITELPVAEIVSADGERYASSLDCMAQNLVKEDCNLAQLPGTYISVRSENVRINEDSAFIDTDFEIYRINKLGCKFFKRKAVLSKQPRLT